MDNKNSSKKTETMKRYYMRGKELIVESVTIDKNENQ